MNICYGALLEAVSIQNYIFQSNTLKTNMGASHLIQNEIFFSYLQKAVTEVFTKGYDFAWESWQKNPNEINIYNDPFEIGYIGGGNALLLFQEKDKAKKVIEAWSRLLLIHAPGVITTVATGPFEPDRFKKSLSDLFLLLKENKAKYIPQTVIPRHGITAECVQSGLSAEVLLVHDKDEKEYLSSVSYAKIDAAKNSRNYFHDKFKRELNNIFCFPSEFEKLGSISGEDSHIAVVHVDGNRMAKRFQDVDSLNDMRKLSISVHKATTEAFSELLTHVVDNYEQIMKEDLGFDPSIREDRFWYPMDQEYNNKCLPLTPIVIGGDDVTFVCDGRLGIYFAKRFIESFEKKEASDRKKLTACAGIAIIKTKYPFYRGYQLSEELCARAKNMNNKETNPEKLISALDFHVSMGGIFGNLKQIRNKHYRAPEGKLLYRPYKLIPADTNDEKSLEKMVELAGQLRERFPRSKIKAIQSVLSLSKDRHIDFVTETECRERSLPEMPGIGYHKTIFANAETIYFDMIELTEFYPNHALATKGEE